MANTQTKTKQEILDQEQVLAQVLKHYQEDVRGKKPAFLGKDIYLIGTGASLHACLQAKYAFLQYVPQNVTVIEACDIACYDAVLNKDSFVILVSQSGESFETKVTCDMLRKRGIPFYGITNNAQSYLHAMADSAFLCLAGDEVSSATKTHTATLLILYLLAAGGNPAAMEQIAEIPARAARTLAVAEQELPRLCAFMGDEKIVYLCGKSAQAPTMRQASLLLKEKVFLHAEGMALQEFRHGPVEALEKGSKVIIAVSGSEMYHDCLTHARFLRDVCGADVALLSDQPCGDESFPHFSFVWGLDEALSHICATIPFQLMAENMAHTRGYDVDGFKYIGKVLNQYDKPMR